MSNEPFLHSNVLIIPVDEFERLKGHYLYVSHRLLRSKEILENAMFEPKQAGTIRRQRRERVTLTEHDAEDLSSLLEDLEERLRKMFVVDEAQRARLIAARAQRGKSSKEIS